MNETLIENVIGTNFTNVNSTTVAPHVNAYISSLIGDIIHLEEQVATLTTTNIILASLLVITCVFLIVYIIKKNRGDKNND